MARGFLHSPSQTGELYFVRKPQSNGEFTAALASRPSLRLYCSGLAGENVSASKCSKQRNSYAGTAACEWEKCWLRAGPGGRTGPGRQFAMNMQPGSDGTGPAT